MNLVPIEYGLQRFLLERAYCPLVDLGGRGGFYFVGYPLRQLLKMIFKLPPQKPRLAFLAPLFQAYCETPLEFAAKYFVVEQAFCHRHFLDP